MGKQSGGVEGQAGKHWESKLNGGKGPVVELSVYSGRTRAPDGTAKQTLQGVEKGEGILRLVSGPPML